MKELLENTRFYGKRISEMGNLEKNLLVTDLLLSLNGQLIFSGRTKKIEILGHTIVLGTFMSQLMFTNIRLKILKSLIDFGNQSDDVLLDLYEKTQYSYEGFMKSLYPVLQYMDEIDIETILGSLSDDEDSLRVPTQFEYSFSMN